MVYCLNLVVKKNVKITLFKQPVTIEPSLKRVRIIWNLTETFILGNTAL